LYPKSGQLAITKRKKSLIHTIFRLKDIQFEHRREEQNMTSKLFIVAIACIASLSVSAQPSSHRYAWAKVTDVRPAYRYVERSVPTEHCWTEVVEYRRGPNATTLVGGIIGGAIGNEIGRGKRHQDLGTALGTVIGMAIAEDIQGNPSSRRHSRERERCEIRYDYERERVLDGYHVEYRYRGHYYETFTRERPGRRIRVNVEVRPAHRG
jgi:uncharacterized protein YcfJ